MTDPKPRPEEVMRDALVSAPTQFRRAAAARIAGWQHAALTDAGYVIADGRKLRALLRTIIPNDALLDAAMLELGEPAIDANYVMAPREPTEAQIDVGEGDGYMEIEIEAT